MSYSNEMRLEFLSLNENESFARLAVASFCANQNLTIEELNDIKTAVSEGVTNAIVHGYEDSKGIVTVGVKVNEKEIEIEIKDNGVGIKDIDKAIQPFYTTKADMERSGMGFTVMEGFMDKMEVSSEINKGTVVKLIKYLNK